MTFLADYLAGRTEAEQIHDHIDEWHDAPEDGRSLHEHLGMSWPEYALWVETAALPGRTLDAMNRLDTAHPS